MELVEVQVNPWSPLLHPSGSLKTFWRRCSGPEQGWLHSSLRADPLCPPVISRIVIKGTCQTRRFYVDLLRGCSDAGVLLSYDAFLQLALPWVPLQENRLRPTLRSGLRHLWWELSHHWKRPQLTFMIVDCFCFCLLGPLPMSRKATWLPSPVQLVTSTSFQRFWN